MGAVQDLTLTDMNNDTILDLVSFDTNAIVWTNIGIGNGTFHPAISSSMILGNGQNFSIGDVNGDGKNDVIGTSSGSGGAGAFLILGNGNGTFKAATTVESTHPFGVDVKLADVDGDGNLDLLRSASGALNVYLGNGNGTFKLNVSSASGATSGGEIGYGDLNGDSISDVLIIQSTGILSQFVANSGSASQLPGLSLTTQSGALSALSGVQSVLANLSRVQGTIGSLQSRLMVALQMAQTSAENYAAAASRIQDADIAESSAELVRRQILEKASSAVLAQANQDPRLALTLLAS